MNTNRVTNRTLHTTRAALSAAIVLLLAPFTLAAQDGELGALAEAVDGEVEVRIDDEEWNELAEGDAVPIDAKISTGFGSSARLAIGENAVLDVEPLTRVTIENLVEDQGVERSELTLEVGRIEGEVERRADESTEFEVRSSVATASVRGTSFTFDGEVLTVTEGSVSLSNAYGQERTVSASEQSSTDGASSPESPSESRRERSSVSTSTSGATGETRTQPGSGGGGSSSEDDTTVTIRFPTEVD